LGFDQGFRRREGSVVTDATADTDGGKMDGLLIEAQKNSQMCGGIPVGCRCKPVNVIGYHTQSDIPNYWKYAAAHTRHRRV